MSLPDANQRLAEMLARNAALLAKAGGANTAIRSGAVMLGPGDVDPLAQTQTPFQQRPQGPGEALGAVARGVGQAFSPEEGITDLMLGPLFVRPQDPLANEAAAAQQTLPGLAQNVGAEFGSFARTLGQDPVDPQINAPLAARMAAGMLIPGPGDPLPTGAVASRIPGAGGFGRRAGDNLGADFGDLPDRRTADLGPPGGVERRAAESVDRRRAAEGIPPGGGDPSSGQALLTDVPQARVPTLDEVVNTEFQRLADRGRDDVIQGVQGVFDAYQAGAIGPEEARGILATLDQDLVAAFDEADLFRQVEAEFQNEAVARLMEADPSIRTVQEARDRLAVSGFDGREVVARPRTRELPLELDDIDVTIRQLVGFDDQLSAQMHELLVQTSPEAAVTPQALVDLAVNNELITPQAGDAWLARFDEVDTERIRAAFPSAEELAARRQAQLEAQEADRAVEAGGAVFRNLPPTDPARMTGLAATPEQVSRVTAAVQRFNPGLSPEEALDIALRQIEDAELRGFRQGDDLINNLVQSIDTMPGDTIDEFTSMAGLRPDPSVMDDVGFPDVNLGAVDRPVAPHDPGNIEFQTQAGFGDVADEAAGVGGRIDPVTAEIMAQNPDMNLNEAMRIGIGLYGDLARANPGITDNALDALVMQRVQQGGLLDAPINSGMVGQEFNRMAAEGSVARTMEIINDPRLSDVADFDEFGEALNDMISRGEISADEARSAEEFFVSTQNAFGVEAGMGRSAARGAAVDSQEGFDAASQSLMHSFTGGDVATWLTAVARDLDVNDEHLEALSGAIAEFTQRGEPITGMDLVDMMARIPGLSNEEAARILRVGGLGLFPGE